MGTSDVITDLLLVAFPIPIVLKSHMATKRKVSLILLFSLSLILIAITVYRVVEVVNRRSDQQFRSLLASFEILAAAAVSNALVLGSFVRDRGVKKQRYRFSSVGGNSSLDRAMTGTRPRALTARTWGSDADLAGELCMRMTPDLEQQQTAPARPRPAPLALPPASHANAITPSIVRADFTFSGRGSAAGISGLESTDVQGSINDDERPPLSPREVEVITPRRTSFFDVGGLLDTYPTRLPRGRATTSKITPLPSPSDGIRRNSIVSPIDTGLSNFPQPRQALGTVRNFSRPLSPTQSMPSINPSLSSAKSHDGVQNYPPHNPGHTTGPNSPSFTDVGGLLD
ncbi:MAG: hypothetical protein Q9223_006809 [Gallowayella weberi]